MIRSQVINLLVEQGRPEFLADELHHFEFVLESDAIFRQSARPLIFSTLALPPDVPLDPTLSYSKAHSTQLLLDAVLKVRVRGAASRLDG